jgi:broad specificity phosphatase PhoE
MERRRIYLMRHGETLYQRTANEGAIGNGALTERGREQIATAALLFHAAQLDRIYSSPLSRAHETAQIIANETGLEVSLDPDLTEITPSEELTATQNLTDIFRSVQGFFTSPTTGWDEPYLGGESFRKVRERGERFLRTVLAQPDWRTLLVVAHGGSNNALLASVLGISDGRVFNIEQDFGCINIIDFVDERPMLRLANFTLYDQLKVKLWDHSLDIILNLLHERGVIQKDSLP